MTDLIKPAFRGRFVGRGPARDSAQAFLYRMGTGFAGSINRSHPFSSEPNFQDATSPVLGYGLGVLVNAAGNGVRQIAAGDSAITLIYGVSVRPFPTQQYQDAVGFGQIAFGAGGPAGANNAIDILKEGYILVPVVGVVKKGGAVYVYVGATIAGHVQGGFESAAGANIAGPITNCTFNGAAGSDGIGELIMQSF